MYRHDLNRFADYGQLYLQDEPANGDLSGVWSQDAVNRLLAVGSGVVGVGTLSADIASASIEPPNSPPSDDSANCDQLNECSLVVVQGLALRALPADHRLR